MRKIGSIYKWLPLVAFVCLTACNDDDEPDLSWLTNPDEKMELTASATEIVLDGEKPNDVVLTFTWTKAREMPSEYTISYVTKMDVEGNSFNTAVRNDEETGVFTKSYTTEELQQLLTGKWGLSVNKVSTIEFRVIAKWDGGPKFAMPEVRTISVDIQPYIPIVFEADEVFLDGSAVPGERITLSKTLENQHQYAWLGELKAGELQIPLEFEQETKYICPVSGEGELLDGIAETVAVRSSAITSWKIETAGEYRIVIDMEKKTVIIYSPAKALKNAIVEWTKDGELQVTEVTDLWPYGEPTGWGWRQGNCQQSLADPQIFIYTGQPLSGRTKFGVAPHNQTYVYSCPPASETASQDVTVSNGIITTLSGGYSTAQRNSYFRLPAGTNFIVLDLRNMKMRAEMRPN